MMDEGTSVDKSPKLNGLLWLIAAILVGAGFAFGVSPLVRAIPWSWEQKMAQLLSSPPSDSVCPGNPQTDALFNRLKARLYPLDQDDEKMPIDIQIVEAPAINAYAALGGKITLDSGLLEEAHSAEEVAGVLAHEMEHVHRRHIMESVLTRLVVHETGQLISSGDVSGTDWGNYFLSMSFSRAQEAEADEGGLRRLQRAHIDNQGFRDFFERMEKSETTPVFLSDHPSGKSRFNRVKEFSNTDTHPIMTHDEWLQFKAYCR